MSIDRQTEIVTSNALDLVGPWVQSPPIDFSRPQLRWFSWGFDKEAFFVAKVRRSGPGPARIVIRGQTCRGESICKEINVSLSLRLPAVVNDTSTKIDLKGLVPVR